MKRMAVAMRLKPGCEQAYIQAHDDIWPDLVAAIKACGIRNHSVFLRGTQLVAVLEADNVEESLRALGAYDVKRRWDERMAELLEPAEPPQLMLEAFHLQ